MPPTRSHLVHKHTFPICLGGLQIAWTDLTSGDNERPLRVVQTVPHSLEAHEQATPPSAPTSCPLQKYQELALMKQEGET